MPSYATSDVRVGWFVAPAVELSIVGQNLHESSHLEWPGSIRIRRAGIVSLTWRR